LENVMGKFAGALLAGMIACTTAAGGLAAEIAPSATEGLRPNLEGHIQASLRYRPDGEDFVIHNGSEFFNRSLYGGNTAFRVDGGDKPEFLLYLPGRGGNLRLALRTAAGSTWLHAAHDIVTRYRPGELRYEIRDPLFGAKGVVRLVAVAYAQTEGLAIQAQAEGLPAGAELIWAYGGVNGERGRRDGDIGTEQVPISQYFQFQPAYANGNAVSVEGEGFVLKSAAAHIAGVLPTQSTVTVADAALWNDLPALLRQPAGKPGAPIAVGRAPLKNGQPMLLSLQRITGGTPSEELDIYKAVSAPVPGKPGKKSLTLDRLYCRAQLPAQFTKAQQHFESLRHKVSIDTPDPYLNAAAGALNVVADALWDDVDQAIMHGSIAWRAKLLGWRGPYALDALGWHERARSNFSTWTGRQNTSAIAERIPAADASSNLARNEAGLHSNGDLSKSHYDMNMVFIDALLRHILWTGDLEYARTVWPVIERHLAWEKRLFRREFGPGQLPLYEAYATIWASDDLYYGGGGVSYASAYNVYANRSAARIARLIGKDGAPYEQEATLIAQAMRAWLWMPERGAFAEYRDTLGEQRLHPSYGLWSFYHTVDSDVPTAQEAWRMASDLKRSSKSIPVSGAGVPDDAAYHVLPSTDWMPYSWSINNVVMGENLHTALALWQAGRAEDAYTLAKGALLASMYMGISPGNVGTMNYLDVYRRESQRDFADGAGVMARTIVEGLFGIRPDALARVLTVHPGFPVAWAHASLRHPDVGLNFQRSGMVERWELTQAGKRFDTLRLRIPAAFNHVRSVTVNGATAHWAADTEAVGRPMLLVDAPMAGKAVVEIRWAGDAITAKLLQPESGAQPGFVTRRSGGFSWMTEVETAPQRAAKEDAGAAMGGPAGDSIDLQPYFNDRVTEIFKPGKYIAPRSRFVSLSLPAQGIGAWAGHVNAMAAIDDSGLRRVAASNGGKLRIPNGVAFATPTEAAAANIIFTSQWSNYPKSIEIPLGGTASHAWLLMAGSTNFMQSRTDNGEIIVTYTDGASARLALNNPVNWWPIEQDYFIDDFQFNRPGPIPPRIDLRTGKVRVPGSVSKQGRTDTAIPGGAATVLDLPLDARKTLKSLTLRVLSNDVVIGLMSVTLTRPAEPSP
jgi:hypothetical protein